MQNKKVLFHRLKIIVSDLADVMAELDEIPASKPVESSLRVFDIPIHNSVLNQNLICFSTDDFGDRLRSDVRFTIHCPSTGTSFETDLVGQFRLRERGKMGHILKKLKAKGGDYLRFVETTPLHFEVSLRTRLQKGDDAVISLAKELLNSKPFEDTFSKI